jgi:diketogulonate reductase-like aldo/keto reductase
MEAEIIPMCEDQGMGIVSWASLGGGQLMSAKQREEKKQDPDAHKGYGFSEADIKVSEALENIAESKKTTIQAVVSHLISCTGYISTNRYQGACLSAAPINICLPNRGSTNSRSRQSITRSSED